MQTVPHRSSARSPSAQEPITDLTGLLQPPRGCPDFRTATGRGVDAIPHRAHFAGGQPSMPRVRSESELCPGSLSFLVCPPARPMGHLLDSYALLAVSSADSDDASRQQGDSVLEGLAEAAWLPQPSRRVRSTSGRPDLATPPHLP